ncbi:MAG: thiamine-phosphate kinase [Planctomycetota bacterium]
MIANDEAFAMLKENELLAFIAGGNSAMPGSVLIPPGDDMAMIRVGDTDLLIAVDPLIEDVHFKRDAASPKQIARKALTRNLSDVAAMAAKPVAAVVAAQLPADTSEVFAQRFVSGFQATASEFACPIVGGDIAIQSTKHPALSLTVTVLAEPAGIAPVRRRTAKVGDTIWVSGVLGGSLEPDGGGHHLGFTPRLALARALAGEASTRPTSMMDVSDGIAMDLPRLVENAEVAVGDLPLRDGIKDPRRALGDGEDYELLFTVDPNASMPTSCEGVPLTRIGTVTASDGVRFLEADGGVIETSELGWEHRGG